MGEILPANGCERGKNYGAKNGNRKIITKKAEWINKMETKLWKLEEGPKVEIHLDAFNTTFKKIPKWKTTGLECAHGFWF